MIKRAILPLLTATWLLFASNALCDTTPPASSENALSPTTGLPTDAPYRPLLAILSNAPEARKYTVLHDADIVYEMIFWGPGHTRYAAVFNDTLPDGIGSLRSARPFYAMLRDEWDCPLVFSDSQGDQPGYALRNHFEIMNVPRSFIVDRHNRLSSNGSLQYRRRDIPSPHNLFFDPILYMQHNWPSSADDPEKPHEPQRPALSFSDTPTQSAESATRIQINYDATNYFATYVYDEDANMYERWYDTRKTVHPDTGEPLMVSNVIVQYCALRYYNNIASLPEIDLIGFGIFDAFIEGKRVSGTWHRESPTSPTVFMVPDGDATSPLLLKPGKTFIQVVPFRTRILENTEQPDQFVFDAIFTADSQSALIFDKRYTGK